MKSVRLSGFRIRVYCYVGPVEQEPLDLVVKRRANDCLLCVDVPTHRHIRNHAQVQVVLKNTRRRSNRIGTQTVSRGKVVCYDFRLRLDAETYLQLADGKLRGCKRVYIGALNGHHDH